MKTPFRTFRLARAIGAVITTICLVDAAPPGASGQLTAFAGEDVSPGFWRLHWYQAGAEHGNPAHNNRFRVNSPQISLHPIFGQRPEARANGMMLILAEEELALAGEPELYIEVWGGHPGAINKRATFNGRSTYALPEVGAAAKHCVYHYPTLRPRRDDLVNGYNAIQFAVDQGATFWGHFIVDNACLRFPLPAEHPALEAAKISGFRANVRVTVQAGASDRITVSLEVPAEGAERISSVDFQARYRGYDENGDGNETDWHGFTKNRMARGHLGTAVTAPWTVVWDASMVPAQSQVIVRAVVHFRDRDELVYVTPPGEPFDLVHPVGIEVALVRAEDLPPEFWSRANKRKSCVLTVGAGHIERAQLQVNTWAGGPGKVKDYFTLNGQSFPVAEGAGHDLQFSTLNVEPALLRSGMNEIVLLSDTEHHGIEVLRPGPCLAIRYRRSP